jgi:polysaccharide export outer membrane protein
MKIESKISDLRFCGKLLEPFLLAVFLIVALPATSAEQTSLSPGDVVRITVYDNADLTTVARIAPNGRITFPLIGDVSIGGISTTEAERLISRLLDQGGFVKNAQVSIFVEERSEALGPSVTILGQVKTSGRFPIRDGTSEGVQTLIDLLAIAGGVTPTAANYLVLIRQSGSAPQKVRIDLADLLRTADVKANVSLSNGDIVLVPEMDVFYIYGQVTRPGRYRLERGMTVMQALAVASGVSETGSEKGILLNRQGPKGLQRTESSLSDELQPDDVLYVNERFF